MTDQARKVRVLIPTTAGPVEVLRLIEEEEAVGRSVVCIGGTTETADIDAGYNAFVACATGVISRVFGHRCYRLDVSGRIDSGSSWQLDWRCCWRMRSTPPDGWRRKVSPRNAWSGLPARCARSISQWAR